MSESDSVPDPEPRLYGRLILRPLNQLVVIAPLLLVFHIASAYIGSNLLVPHFMQIAFQWLGASGHLLPPLLIVTVLLCQHVMKKEPWQVDFMAAGGTILESIVWTLPLLTAGWIIGSNTEAAIDHSQVYLHNCIEAIGAGIYEEFIFRMVLIQVGSILLIDLANLKKDRVMIFLILFSALIFSACHFSSGELFGAETMNWEKFVFLSTAGVWWSVLFLWRGYGVAACCHIAWNITAIFCNM